MELLALLVAFLLLNLGIRLVSWIRGGTSDAAQPEEQTAVVDVVDSAALDAEFDLLTLVERV